MAKSKILETILNYKKANKDFRALLADEANFQYIIDSMPTEFNIGLIRTLRKRKITNEEGRYRAGLALLFLKYLYEKIKPFPDDEFILQNYDDYYASLEYLQVFHRLSHANVRRRLCCFSHCQTIDDD